MDDNYETVFDPYVLNLGEWHSDEPDFMWIRPTYIGDKEGVLITCFDDHWSIMFCGNRTYPLKKLGGIYDLMFPKDKQYTKDMVEQLKSDIDKFLVRVDRLKAFI